MMSTPSLLSAIGTKVADYDVEQFQEIQESANRLLQCQTDLAQLKEELMSLAIKVLGQPAVDKLLDMASARVDDATVGVSRQPIVAAKSESDLKMSGGTV